MEQKFEELKKYMDDKFSQQDGSLKEMCKGLIENFTKEVTSEIKKQLDDQITRLEADKAMLQEQIKNLLLQNQRNQEDVEEPEQYGRRLCLRTSESPQKKMKPAKMF